MSLHAAPVIPIIAALPQIAALVYGKHRKESEMNRASPVETRKALEVANIYAKAGIPFIPMPVLSEEQRQEAILEAARRIEQEA